MPKFGEFDFSEFLNVANKLKNADALIDEFIKDFLLEMGQRAIAKIKPRTPVGVYKDKLVKFTTKDGKEIEFIAKSHGKVGGTLRENWKLGDVIKDANGYHVEISNNTHYAIYVEYGHRVAGNLTKFIPGKFMMTVSMQEIEKEFPVYLERRVAQFLNDLFSGK